MLGDARDAGLRARSALQARALPDRARLVVTSPPYLRVVKYGYYNWMRAWLLGEDPEAIDAALDDAFVELHVWDTVHEQTPQTVGTLIDSYMMAGLVELIGTSKSSWS